MRGEQRVWTTAVWGLLGVCLVSTPSSGVRLSPLRSPVPPVPAGAPPTRRQWLAGAAAAAAGLGGMVSNPKQTEAFWQFWQADDMLLYVDRYATPGNADSVLAAMDKAAETSWMMNIGQEKGQILEGLLEKHRPRSVLEVGTFLGYSSIRIARHLPEGGRLVSIEKDPVSAAAARTILRTAAVDLEDRVQLLVGAAQDRLADAKRLNQGRPFDFVFMDHWKEDYDDELQRLERVGLLRKGTVVLADNVICPGAPDYLEYLDAHQSKYSTELISVPFEYRPETPDAMSVSVVLA